MIDVTNAGGQIQTVQSQLYEDTHREAQNKAISSAMKRAREKAEQMAATEDFAVAGVQEAMTKKVSTGIESLVDEVLASSPDTDLRSTPITVSEGVEVVYEHSEERSEGMDEVANGLFVGTIEDAGDNALIRKHSITTIVSLTYSDPDDGFPSNLTVKTVPMVDGPRNDQQRFDRAVSYVLSCLETENDLLVHCSAGASRNPAVAATSLAVYNEIRLEAAFEQVAKRRNTVDSHEAIIRQATRVYTQHTE